MGRHSVLVEDVPGKNIAQVDEMIFVRDAMVRTKTYIILELPKTNHVFVLFS